MTLYRMALGAPLPEQLEATPEPNVSRIPRTFDGCTWLAAHPDSLGEEIAATGRTKKDALESFKEIWQIFAGRLEQ